MELIKGSESLFYIVKNGVTIPVGCLTSNPIEENSEMMETTTRDNAGWRTSIPTMQSYTIPLEGFMTYDDENSGNNIISYRELRRIKRDKELIVWKIKTLKGLYVDSGKAYIESIAFTDPVDDMIGFNASLVGYGMPSTSVADYDIYSDPITYSFTYSHEPENDPNSGEFFLTNMLFVNYFNAFGIEYDCDLKVKLASVPARGFLANNITRDVYSVNDLISYCDKDDLVYFPNGFDNDLGVQGNFTELFSYRIVDQDGILGRLTTHTLIMTDSSVEPIDLSVSIVWGDYSSTPKEGNAGNINVRLFSLVFDPADPVVTQEWEIFNGTDWVFYKDYTVELEEIALSFLENKIRFKAVTQYGVIAYSNILQYTKTSESTIYITDEVIVSPGVKTYKLHVEGEAFVGLANLQAEKNANTRNGNVLDSRGGLLVIPNANDIGEYVTKSVAVNIPIGVYDYEIKANGNPRNSAQNVEVNGLIAYGYTENVYDGIAVTQVNLLIEP